MWCTVLPVTTICVYTVIYRNKDVCHSDVYCLELSKERPNCKHGFYILELQQNAFTVEQTTTYKSRTSLNILKIFLGSWS